MTTSNNFDFSSLGKINFKILSPCISPTCHHQPPNTPHLPPPFFTTSLSLILDDGTLGSCMARTWRFTSHGHLILCRGWLCQNWKLSCTHLVTKKGSCCRQVSSPDDVIIVTIIIITVVLITHFTYAPMHLQKCLKCH